VCVCVLPEGNMYI